VIDYLSLEDLLTIIERYRLQAVRDLGLLDSAAHRPQTSLFGDDAYPSIDEKAAVLLESIVRNHPLIDGNKRLGWIATVMFLELNGLFVDAPLDDAYDLVIAVATGEMSYQESAARLAAWTSTST
jgi:death on curing protein